MVLHALHNYFLINFLHSSVVKDPLASVYINILPYVKCHFYWWLYTYFLPEKKSAATLFICVISSIYIPIYGMTTNIKVHSVCFAHLLTKIIPNTNALHDYENINEWQIDQVCVMNYMFCHTSCKSEKDSILVWAAGREWYV